MKFTTTVQQYDNTQDLYIEIPHYILQNLNWEEGDELAWSIKGNQIILTKVKDASSTKEEPTMSDYDWYSVKEEAINEYLNSESEGKEYKDFDQQYEAYLYSFSPEAQGSWNQGNEQSKGRTVPPPANFPHFP
jgi:antitoxin component of MazEF toxin-antitoxin module